MVAETIQDRIHIRDLRLRCIIGTNDDERALAQDVAINITLFANLRRAGQTDRLEDTVNYKTLKKSIVRLVEGSRFFLIERLAEAVADACLEEPRVERVTVTVDKPGALRYARAVAVEITRQKENKA